MKYYISCSGSDISRETCNKLGIEYAKNYGIIYDTDTKKCVNINLRFLYEEARKEINSLPVFVDTSMFTLIKFKEILDKLPPINNIIYIDTMEDMFKLKSLNHTYKKYDLENLNIEIL